jgi:DNA invertase Pin-like site-specific DNA recombinase
MPNANKVMLQMHAVKSERERDQISARTRAALAQAKARGVALGVAGRRNLEAHRTQRTRDAEAFAARLKGRLRGFRAAGSQPTPDGGRAERAGNQGPPGVGSRN